MVLHKLSDLTLVLVYCLLIRWRPIEHVFSRTFFLRLLVKLLCRHERIVGTDQALRINSDRLLLNSRFRGAGLFLRSVKAPGIVDHQGKHLVIVDSELDITIVLQKIF